MITLRIMEETEQDLAAVIANIERLASAQVLVGFPEAENMKGVLPGEMNLAARAYISDRGAPEANIPQREFMAPGVALRIKSIEGFLSKGARLALDPASPWPLVKMELEKAGLRAVSGVQEKIRSGPFQALAPYTLEKRKRLKIKSVAPLIATEAMYRGVTYLVKVPR